MSAPRGSGGRAGGEGRPASAPPGDGGSAAALGVGRPSTDGGAPPDDGFPSGLRHAGRSGIPLPGGDRPTHLVDGTRDVPGADRTEAAAARASRSSRAPRSTGVFGMFGVSRGPGVSGVSRVPGVSAVFGASRVPAPRAAAADGTGRQRGEEPGRWTRPVASYRLSAGYGGSGSHWAHRHTGQDFAVPVGTPVRAVGRGEVVSVECRGPFGMSVVLRHPDGAHTQYAHLSTVLVAPGDRVRAGEWVALSGDTGNSTGPHLHFEVRRTPAFGTAVDPVPWLRRHGVRLRSSVPDGFGR
ncbi:M23 family metallopeptidase [Streptomyces palmae]|uniref:M23 family metallopeptidase n=2 Tax=Streptomyces palmae TaxID=1701085 RepID=A0A4Z0GQH6_9ACTN|nr:M23 family metallopeptidase [Streptomyces palmae]